MAPTITVPVTADDIVELLTEFAGETPDEAPDPLVALYDAIGDEVGHEAAVAGLAVLAENPDAVEVERPTSPVDVAGPPLAAAYAPLPDDVTNRLAELSLAGHMQAPKRRMVTCKGTGDQAEYIERAKPAGKWVYGLYSWNGHTIVMVDGTWYLDGESTKARNLHQTIAAAKAL